jgi:hypothetical protein
MAKENANDKIKKWDDYFKELPELQCNHCGVVFKGNHECNYEKLKEKVEKLQNQLDAEIMFVSNGMEEEQYLLQEKVIRYEKALEEINQTAIYYDSRGWALNPDRIGKIVVKALDY